MCVFRLTPVQTLEGVKELPHHLRSRDTFPTTLPSLLPVQPRTLVLLGDTEWSR